MTIITGVILAVFSLFAPRTILATIWATNCTYNELFAGWFWPLAGTIFAPYTTLACLVSFGASDTVGSLGVFVIFVAAIICDVLNIIFSLIRASKESK